MDVIASRTWLFEHRRLGSSAAELTPMAWRDLGCPGAIRPMTTQAA